MLEIDLRMRTEWYDAPRGHRRVAYRVVGPVFAVDVSRDGWLRVLRIGPRIDEPVTAEQRRLARTVALSVALTAGPMTNGRGL